MPRLGLHMIVKDESRVIERCLASVRPFVDWWVVSDTGSTDGTQEIVRRVLAGVPGRLIERPWVSFGHNRQEALDAARDLEHSAADDHVLWIDADEELIDLPTPRPELSADGYFLPVEYGAVRYARLAVVRLDRPWQWHGAIHEYLAMPDGDVRHLTAPRVLVHHEGARAHDPDTYRKDAAIIEAELVRTPGDPRLQFYLGQSWKDAQEPARAVEAYRLRIANPDGWDQERWYAMLQVAVCLERLSAAPQEVATAYLDAFSARPTRAEPLVELARFERGRERFAIAAAYARAAARVPPPPQDDLFVDHATYEWRALDELAVSCYWAGYDDEGLPAARAAAAARPDDARLQDNVEWFLRRQAAGLPSDPPATLPGWRGRGV